MLKTAGKQGEMKKRITVSSNDPKTPSLVLEIAGTVLVDVMVEPRNVGFRQLGKGADATQALTIRVPEPERIKVAAFTVDDPRFELKQTKGELTGESEWELKFKGSQEIGSFQATALVKYSDGGAEKTLEVPIRVSVVGDLQYVRSIHFGKAPDAGFSPREVRISSRSGKNVKIKKVEDPDGLLDIELVTPEGNPAVFKATVRNPDGDYSTPKQHVLKVSTDDKDEPIVEVNYMISLRAAMPGRGAIAPMGMPRITSPIPGKAGAAPNRPNNSANQ